MCISLRATVLFTVGPMFKWAVVSTILASLTRKTIMHLVFYILLHVLLVLLK